jgi:beta-hydroxyacyl-ACP dehydratase FabZ
MSGGADTPSENHTEAKLSPKSSDQRPTKWELPLDADQICRILPHRFPFLLIDRITKLEDRSACGIKNVTVSEPYLQAHSPGRMTLPSVLTIEATAQVGAVLVLTATGSEGKLPHILSIEKAKFHKPIYPGDRMDIEVKVVRAHKRYGKLRGEVRVDGVLVTETEITYMMPE